MFRHFNLAKGTQIQFYLLPLSGNVRADKVNIPLLLVPDYGMGDCGYLAI